MNRCEHCGELLWLGMPIHECLPQWFVWDPENGDYNDWKPVFARDSQSAAEAWAEKNPDEWYDLDEDSVIEVCVCLCGDDEPDAMIISRYHVSRVISVSYNADEVERLK